MNVIKEIYRFTNRFIKEYRTKILGYVIAGMLLYVITAVIPLLVGRFIDSFTGSVSVNSIILLCACFLGLSVLQVILMYYVKVEGTKISVGASSQMKSKFYLHMQKVSPLNNRIDDPSALTSRVNNQCEYLIMFLCNFGMQFPGKCVTIAIIYIYLLIKNWPIAIVALLVIPVLAFFHKKTRDVIYETSTDKERARNHFFAIMNEQLVKMPLIRMHGIFGFEQERLRDAQKDLQAAAVREQRKSFKYTLFGQNTDVFLKIFLFVFGGIFIMKGKITVGSFTVLYSYLGILSDNLSYFIDLSQEAYQYKAFMDGLKEIDQQREENIGAETIKEVNAIEVKGMNFGYSDDNVLYRDYDNRFEKGKIYCLAGDNGAGKSTLIKNIVGIFIDATGENVFYDKKSISALNIYDVRNRVFGVCEQEPDMLDDTIYNNLLYMKDEVVDFVRLKKICEKLELFDDMGSVEEFKEFIMSRNALELSGGQKQKFALVRAIYKNPSVLVLDEPSSALDKSGTDKLKLLLNELKEDKIILMISHDLDMIEFADQIVKVA